MAFLHVPLAAAAAGLSYWAYLLLPSIRAACDESRMELPSGIVNQVLDELVRHAATLQF